MFIANLCIAETKPVEEVKKSEKLTPEQLLVDDYIRDYNISFFTETSELESRILSRFEGTFSNPIQ